MLQRRPMSPRGMALQYPYLKALLLGVCLWVLYTLKHIQNPRGLEGPSVSILHVTKEFGPATMGGLGHMVTSLVSAQQKEGRNVSVMIPGYSYILENGPVRKIGTVDVQVGPLYMWDSWRKSSVVQSDIYMIEWPLGNVSVPLYLVGPSTRWPLNKAFRADDARNIYEYYAPVSTEWRDLYFSKASTVWACQSGVNIAHVHGATNGFVAYFIKKNADCATRVAYTLHDVKYEFEYSNLVSNIKAFGASMDEVARYIPVGSKRAFTSGLGIRSADAVSLVSKTLANDVLTIHAPFQEFAIQDLKDKVNLGMFRGISNGLDLASSVHNPFNNGNFSFVGNGKYLETKRRAKIFLMRNLGLPEGEINRPWLLFIGRFQYIKGVDVFESLLRRMRAHNSSTRLIALGEKNNYPPWKLETLAKMYPESFMFSDDVSEQDVYGDIWRMASDIAFVPSWSEAFGLVALEGLRFGMPVLTSGVGGLGEFLSPSNSFTCAPPALYYEELSLYEAKSSTTAPHASDAVLDAVALCHVGKLSHAQDFLWNLGNRREQYVRGLVESVEAHAWDRGPLREYDLLYQSTANGGSS